MKKNYYHVKKVDRSWTKQPNAVLHDERLTSDAKVILYDLLAVSGDFHISESGIASSVHMSLERVKKAVRLLRSTGYVQISKVKDGSRFGGYEWGISDVSGNFRETEIQTLGNQASENPDNQGSNSERRKTERSEIGRLETTPIYELPKDQTLTMKDEEDEGRIYEETEERDGSLTFTPINQSGEPIMSQAEVNITQAFNHFCEVYPRLGNKEQARAAFFAIPDISKICWQIANSVEWFEKSGRWDNWQTGQKNVSCPGAVKFLQEGHWKQYLRSSDTMSTKDRILAVLAKENDNEVI